MSKLFLLVLMMSFFAIPAFAGTGEEKIKDDCFKKTGSYGGSNPKSPYQLCLRANGIVRVERNISGKDDASKTDARICDASNPICSKCIGLYGSGDAKSARTKITECVKRENAKAQAAAKPKTQPKKEITYNGGTLNEVTVMGNGCTKTTPRHCTTELGCLTNNGVWDDQARACAAAPCPSGTTADPKDSKYCVCDNESAPYSIERGSLQQCPSMCKTEDHQIYNIVKRGCLCVSGYEDRTGFGTCVSTAAPQPKVAECIQELQDKITACNTASTAAVAKCDPKAKANGDDTLGALQNLLQGAAMTSGGAARNCGQAAVAGATGYYAIEELRGKCDTEINTCKTSCSDATAFINANKERAYQECRRKDWNYYGGINCRFDNPYPEALTEDAWNARFDETNKIPFEQKIQQMQTSVTDYSAKCDVGGTADSNRDKMTGFMDDMNSAFKGANQCECQLNSGGNCDNQVGPAECAGNPSLPGCAQAQINCLGPSDNSPRCICFKNPSSEECKNTPQAIRSQNGSNINAFAGVGGTSAMGGGIGGSGSGGSEKTEVNVGDLSGLNENGEAMGTSGTATADAGSPFGAVAGSGGSSGGSGSGGAENPNAASADGDDESTGKKLGGLFDVAKSALGNLFKKGPSEKGTATGADSQRFDENGNPIDPKKFRPRGMVRGLAGNDTEIGGKFEDIWKVMNKQYKVQDQKDTFIFGGEKK